MKSSQDKLNEISDIALRFRPSSNVGSGGSQPSFTFLEFFAGGGMARAGLGPGWKCLFANDFDHKKSIAYRDNWRGDVLLTQDVHKVTTNNVTDGRADFAWASFPCQDLSVAGMGAGLRGDRSGTFWPFWNLMLALKTERRAPRVMVFENVCGTLTSHGGKDFAAIADSVTEAGYYFGAVVIDAAEFVPQSRKRLFMIAASHEYELPHCVVSDGLETRRYPKSVWNAYNELSVATRENWIWWNVPFQAARATRFAELIEDEPSGVRWHTPAETSALLAMMSRINLEKVESAKKAGRVMVGGVYRRTRRNADGTKVQRAEVRFDDVAGCLRTSTGGSSRQTILVVEADSLRSRLISARETARLMGLPDTYKLPSNYNEAYHLTGDGVVVPVVRHLANSVLEPLLMSLRADHQRAIA